MQVRIVSVCVMAILLGITAGCGPLNDLWDNAGRTLGAVGDAGKEVDGMSQMLRSEIRRNEPRMQRMADDAELLVDHARDVADSLADAGKTIQQLSDAVQQALPKSGQLETCVSELLKVAEGYRSDRLMDTARACLLEDKTIPQLAKEIDDTLRLRISEFQQTIHHDVPLAASVSCNEVLSGIDPRIDVWRVELTEFRTCLNQRMEEWHGQFGKLNASIEPISKSLSEFSLDQVTKLMIILTALLFCGGQIWDVSRRIVHKCKPRQD